MAVAVALLAALVVVPAAAFDSPGTAGDTVFIQVPAAGSDAETAGVIGTMSAGMPAIAVSKSSIIRGNDFIVTVTGEPRKEYHLSVREVDGLDPGEHPEIAPGQVGVTNNIGSAATVTTNVAGTRFVQFDTDQSTGERRFTIRVEDPANPDVFDEAEVLVERGAVTVFPSGTGFYHMGDEIVFSGTNTDNDVTYLFLTGPNLPPNGIGFEDLRKGVLSAGVQTGNESTFTRVDVDTDDTWTYRWNTSLLYTRILDAGVYTVYALPEPRARNALNGAPYSTTSILLQAPFVEATTSAVVAKGDDLVITGTATGDPTSVRVWIFGENYYRFQQPAPVGSDGTFEYTISFEDTMAMHTGRYDVVVQHPYDDAFDVRVSGTTLTGNDITPVNLTALQPREAADALIAALDSQFIDTYTNFTFIVEEPRIFIDPIAEPATGSTFTVAGTTSLAAGNLLSVEVIPVAGPADNSTDAGTVAVVKGDGLNRWSFEVNATGFRPGQYVVTVESIRTAATQNATFTVIESRESPLSGDNLTLAPGWNFISIPQPLASGNDTAAIFSAVDTDGHSVLRYDTASGTWIALTLTDPLVPLEGIWIYSAGPATVALNFSTALPVSPPERSLVVGWNAVGFPGTSPMTARDALYSVDGQWTTLIGFNGGAQAFEAVIVNGGSGQNADTRAVYPGRGYWLYMAGPGTLGVMGV
ncbi:hypothetical protein [Methanoculleus horonobensis]|uniref:hypothetical protein n=1 Tax=Methanoculleus horonobensis TaxID=528314 RepID=UPI000A6408BB|nr:hypothetical protein [Methanoculleus horonobensis]